MNGEFYGRNYLTVNLFRTFFIKNLELSSLDMLGFKIRFYSYSAKLDETDQQ